jgi:diacylglycerol kinase family enzyme
VAGIGGDGTHSGIINGLMQFGLGRPAGAKPTYAFIPLGTGNDIAKSLGIRLRDDYSTRDLRRAVSTIAHGADYRMDLGLIKGTYFADALTIGLDSRILKERNVSKRKIEKIPLLKCLGRGRLLYTVSLGSRFFMHEPLDAEVVVDGVSWYQGKMINVIVNNTRIYAGDFDFSMEAYPDDGVLDVVLFTDHKDYLTRYLLAVRHNPDKIREFSDELHRRSMHIQGRNVEIRLVKSEHAQLDGEEFPDDSLFRVSVVPQALAIKTPAEPM